MAGAGRIETNIGSYMGCEYHAFPGVPGYWNATMGVPAAYTAGYAGVRVRVLSLADCRALAAAAVAAGLEETTGEGTRW